MGYLNAGLFGEVRNKIGGVIFSNWKGINTAREYKVPANPQSVAQTAQRTKFAAIVSLAQALLGTLIVTFWNPFAVKMSGFNAFIKSVFPNVTSAGLITADCKVTSGTLESLGLVPTPSYDNATGNMVIDWNGNVSGNGELTDDVNLLIVNKNDNSIIYYEPACATRTNASYEPTITSGLTATNLLVFIWASRGTGSSFIVSDSEGLQATTL